MPVSRRGPGSRSTYASIPMSIPLSIVLLAGFHPGRAHAQGTPPAARSAAAPPTVQLRGLVYDSLRHRPVPRAVIEIANLPHTALSDDEGRFHIDSVPAGKLRLTFSAPSLDSLGLFAFANDIDASRGTDGIQLATPSFHTMYERLCAPTDRPPHDSAIVFGAVRDGQAGATVAAARVAFKWAAATSRVNDVTLDAMRETRTSADGSYGVCGLPASQALRAQASTDLKTSALAELRVGDARITRVDLVLVPTAVVASDVAAGAAGAVPSSTIASLDAPTREVGADRAAYLARKRTHNGVFLERESFAKKLEMGSVLHAVSGLDVIRASGKYRYRVNGCEPILVIDGKPQVPVDDLLQAIAPADLQAIEFHRMPANNLPRDYLRGHVVQNDGIGAAATCGGVLVLWTKDARW